MKDKDNKKPDWENPEQEDWCLEDDCSENLPPIEDAPEIIICDLPDGESLKVTEAACLHLGGVVRPKHKRNPSLPSASQTVKNLAADAMKNFRHVMKRKKVLVDEQIAIKRLKICDDCEYKFMTAKARLRCQLCGCFMDIKAHLAASSCPKDKWPAEENKGK